MGQWPRIRSWDELTVGIRVGFPVGGGAVSFVLTFDGPKGPVACWG